MSGLHKYDVDEGVWCISSTHRFTRSAAVYNARIQNDKTPSILSLYYEDTVLNTKSCSTKITFSTSLPISKLKQGRYQDIKVFSHLTRQKSMCQNFDFLVLEVPLFLDGSNCRFVNLTLT